MGVPAVGRWWQRWLAAILVVFAIIYYFDVGRGSSKPNQIRFDSSGNPIPPVRGGSRLSGSNVGLEDTAPLKDESRPGGPPQREQPLAPSAQTPSSPDHPTTGGQSTSDHAATGGHSGSNRPSGFVESAHRLRSADDFLPHFRAVTALPALSISDARTTCRFDHEERVNFQYVVDTDWVVHPKSDEYVSTHRNNWHDYILHDMIPYSNASHQFEDGGRGIVIVAGDGDSFKRTRVLLHALVQLNSSLPVEIQYFQNEMNSTQHAALRDIYPNISFLDLSRTDNVMNVTTGLFLNYQFKTAALINSHFAEPLLLDSDNVPAQDPALLYDAPTYREYGTVFWPDIARTRPVNPMWAITDTPCRPDEYEQESGQLLVDKRRFFYHLQLASWFINQPDYGGFLLGDKDMFRFAWHALKTPYGRPRKWITSIGFAVDEDDPTAPESFSSQTRRTRKTYCGHSFGQHHPDSGAVAFVHMGLSKNLDYTAVTRLRASGGMFQAYKRSPHDEDKTFVERVGIKAWFAGWYVTNTPSPDPDEVLLDYHRGRVSQCVDLYDVDYHGLELVAPGFEQMYDRAGGYWIVDDRYDWGP